MYALVTGGAGFIGSHLVDALMLRGFNVCVLDNLSKGALENLSRWRESSRFTFIKGDLLTINDVTKSLKDRQTIFHLAANPEVRTSSVMPEVHFNQNVTATYNLLEAIRKTESIKALVFTSSSTVYGEPSKVPTPEEHAPLLPISVHGASKLACEALITGYTLTYGFKSIIYRLANIVGARSTHGVIYDFIQKLLKNPKVLEILGDGFQTKSYLHVSDCIEAILLGLTKSSRQVGIFNIGSEDQVDVRTIAKIVTDEMGIEDVEFRFTGGLEGGRGWEGDVKNMLLSVGKLKSLGWQPTCNSAEAVRMSVRELLPK